jgi:hypothetical protein
MGRLVPLSWRVFAAGLGLIVSGGVVLPAQTTPPPTPPAKAPATNTASAKPPAGAVAAARPPITSPALPPAMQNTLGRYGNILAPGDQVSYPLKLKLPFPSDAEVRVPKPDDLVKRQKLEELAKLSDDDLRKQLAQWPAYGKMSLRDQGNMLQRIQDFRDYHAHVAQQKAHDMGLLTLTPDQKARFEKEYWDQRLKLDEDLAKQFQPIYQAREQKMNDALFREFSSSAPAPPAPKPVPTPANSPVKPVASTVTNATPPIAQTQH